MRFEPINDCLIIGVITGTHGVGGRLRVRPLTDEPERFLRLNNCRFFTDGQIVKEYEIVSAQIHGRQILLQLSGIDSIEEAQKLHGMEIAVDRSEAIELGPDNWFIPDLIGCEVHDEERGCLGKVKNILVQPHHDVYIVQNKGEKDLLFPALKTIIRNIDPEKKIIEVKLPAGLYEIYREIVSEQKLGRDPVQEAEQKSEQAQLPDRGHDYDL